MFLYTVNTRRVMALHSIKNKVAVITGAAQGIGLAIVKEFLENDAKTVILLDIKDGTEISEKLNSKYGSNKAIYIKCDVTQDLETVSKYIFEMVDAVDILVNNAGIINETCIRTTMEVNAIATMKWTLKFFKHMRSKNNNGAIINISSRCVVSNYPILAVYNASKCAIMGFSKTFGHPENFSRYGVRIMVVCPGGTVSDIGKNREHTFKMFDDHNIEYWLSNSTELIAQKPESVGRAVVEVFEKGGSGTAWLIENDQPVTEIL